MQAVLMAGGEGRRLRPVTHRTPKPLVPLGEVSVLEMVLRQLRWYGFREVVLCVGYMAEQIVELVGDGGRFGLRVRYHEEDRPRGTMGALRGCSEWLEDEFLVLNGDVCTDLNFADFLRFHRSHEAMATVAAYRRIQRLELGVLTLDASGQRLAGFEEKPEYPLWVAMGVNALDRRTVELIDPEGSFGFDDLMLTLLEQQQEVRVRHHEGFWLDIGHVEDYERMLDLLPSMRGRLFPDTVGAGG